MNANILELNNNQNLEHSRQMENSLAIVEEQNRFLDSRIGRVINQGIDFGIRAIFPNFLEDKVIGVKDAFINEGLNAAARQAVDSALELGRRALRNISEEVLEIHPRLEKLLKEAIYWGV